MSGADPTPPVAPPPEALPETHLQAIVPPGNAPGAAPAVDGLAAGGDQAPDGYLDAALRFVFTPQPQPRPDEAPQDRAPAAAPPGGISSRYSIERELARGGMGIVYEVEDKDFGRQLAMKMLRPSSAGATGGPRSRGADQDRFLEEARITAQLGHPGIVPVHDLGFDAEGRPYFTMDRVHGRTLADVLEGRSWSEAGAGLSSVLGILVKVCQAVAYAHSKSVVHRDLKPTNVMVGKYGEVYVMDWGLAKIIGAAPDVDSSARPATPDAAGSGAVDTLIIVQGTAAPLATLEGSIIGTPAYMAPEQARGATAQVDHLSDIYSLGAMLYQMLAGVPPYVGGADGNSSKKVLARVLAGLPEPILELQPRAPVELVAICNKAMRREKSSRYTSCLELAEDLQAYLDNRVVQAHRTGAIAEARAWVRRNRGTAITTAAALCLLAGAAMALLVTLRRHNEVLSRQVYAYDISRASAAFGARNMEILRSSLDECPVEYRGWEWRRLRRLASISHHAYSGHRPGAAVLAVAVHPNGSEFASGAEDNTVRLWKVGETAAARTLWAHTAQIAALAYSRDGALLAAGADDGTVKVFDTSSGATRYTFQESSPVRSVCMHPDGDQFLTGTLQGEMQVRRLAIGQAVATFPSDASRIIQIAIDGTGKWLAVATERNGLRLWDFATRRPLRELHMPITRLAFQLHRGSTRLWMGSSGGLQCVDVESGEFLDSFQLNKGRVNSLSCSADGSKLVATDNALRLLDLRRNDTLLALVHEQSHPYVAGAISPEGRTVIGGTQHGELYSWDVSETLGQRVFLEPEAKGKWSVAIHPTKSWIAAARWDGTAILWDIEAARVLRTFAGHTQEIRSLCFDRSGERLATAAFDATVKVWEVGTGRELATFTGHSEIVSDAVFSPDGRVVASASKDRTVKVWDADTGRLIRSLSGHRDAVWWVDFSPDGRWIASGSVDATLAIWDAATGARLRTLSGHAAPVDGVEFSPDGATVASCSFDGTLKLWMAATGDCLQTLRGHAGFITGFAFTPDGRRILSVADDGQLKVWEVETGRELVSLPCAKDTTDIAIARDTVATVTKSGALILWEAAAEEATAGATGDAAPGDKSKGR